jgi:1,4-dihydroxy-2-naphthoate octaprenyltransferase
MKTSLKNWILAVRPWAFPASTMPVVLTISYVFYQAVFYTAEINWWFGLIALIGVMFLHAGGNLISDYYDFKNMVSTERFFWLRTFVGTRGFSAADLSVVRTDP